MTGERLRIAIAFAGLQQASRRRARHRAGRATLRRHQAWRREAQLRVSERDYQVQVQRGEDGMPVIPGAARGNVSIQEAGRRASERIAARTAEAARQSEQGAVDEARAQGASAARRETQAALDVCKRYGRLDLLPSVIGMSTAEAEQFVVGELWGRGMEQARAQHLPVTVEPPQ